jgi:hypothetical protein
MRVIVRLLRNRRFYGIVSALPFAVLVSLWAYDARLRCLMSCGSASGADVVLLLLDRFVKVLAVSTVAGLPFWIAMTCAQWMGASPARRLIYTALFIGSATLCIADPWHYRSIYEYGYACSADLAPHPPMPAHAGR